MNKLALVLVLIAFNGTPAFAASLPSVSKVGREAEMPYKGNCGQAELISNRTTPLHSIVDFADPPEPPTRGGSDPGFKEISG
ncbi:hypothetical protein ACN4EK_30330 [Pantanalinema rosaneae CENA516]|uniref:hypothetical protein n=1 Tax=Pantanalinema rosaneae TaxID=1620701 RepID=UPI003D6FF1A7